MPTVIELAQQYRQQLDRGTLQAATRLLRAYKLALDRLTVLLDALLLQIDGMSENPSTGQILKMSRYRALIRQIETELAGLSAITGNEITLGARQWVGLGERAGREMLSATSTGTIVISGEFNRLPKDAIETLLGFLAPEGPLFQRLRQLAPNTAQQVADKLVAGLISGQGPRVVARQLNDAFGQGLTEALRMVRTSHVYAYREANRASFIANSDVVEGWFWYSQLIPGRTCMSCVEQHGTFHTLDEALNDHHNGLCVPLPAVEGMPNPVEQAGSEWFAGQPDGVKRQMLGPGKYNAYQASQIGFGQFSTVREDDVYGPMRIEQSLKAMLP